jgi:hypothetical protein
MIADIRHHLQAGPFEPFSIVTSSDVRCHVPSADHIGFNPHGSRVVIWFDDDSSVTVSGLHIVAIEKESPKRSDQLNHGEIRRTYNSRAVAEMIPHSPAVMSPYFSRRRITAAFKKLDDIGKTGRGLDITLVISGDLGDRD